MELLALYTFVVFCCFNLTITVCREISQLNFITKDEFDTAKIQENIRLPSSFRIHNSTRRNRFSDNIEHNNGKIGTRNFMNNNIWPNGRVPYIINANIEADGRIEVAKAFLDFHSKTCIKFVPKEESDIAYVDILRDDNECGLALLCRTGGAQFAKFGGGCKDALTMIHELAHTLCMTHEQERFDRDDYIRFEGCDPSWKTDPTWFTALSLYDYYSIMHYDGGWPNSCMQSKMELPPNNWFGAPDRLSVLDAEKINARYNCGGCLSYRWKIFDQLTPDDILEPVDDTGNSLYICRFYVKGEIIVGKSNLAQKSCWVPFENGEVGSMGSQKFEILTNPERKYFAWLPMKKGDAIPSGSIAGGRKTMKGPYGLPETYFIARCRFQGILTPGSLHEESRKMFVSWGFYAHECDEFEVLTCN